MEKTTRQHLRAAIIADAAESLAQERGIDPRQAKILITHREKAIAMNRARPSLAKAFW